MLSSKSTILFDLDGTLFDSIPTILKSFQETFQTMGIEYPGDDAIKKHIGSDLKHILSNFFTKEKIELARQTYRDAYLSKQNAGLIFLFPQTKDILKHLKKQNYKLGIVTSKKRKHSASLLQSNQISDFFEIIIGSEDVQNAKPHAEPLLKALNNLNKTKEESIYIGDALIDMQAAQNAEMDFIAITTGTTTSEDFQKNGQKIILKNLIDLKNTYF